MILVGNTSPEMFPIDHFKDTAIIPFLKSFPPGQEIDLRKRYGDHEPGWIEKSTWRDDEVHHFEKDGLSAMYLFKTIESKIDTIIDIYIGSDNAVKIWLNQALFHSNKVFRDCAPGSDYIV